MFRHCHDDDDDDDDDILTIESTIQEGKKWIDLERKDYYEQIITWIIEFTCSPWTDQQKTPLFL